MSDRTLVVDGLCVSRGGTTIIECISAAFPAGAITGICGPNGAGKSTLLAAMADVLSISAGTIKWQGQNLAPENLSFMPQAIGIRAQLSVLEVVLLGRLDMLRWALKPADIDAAADALDLVGMKGLAGRQVGTLSGGQQQLVLLAQRLIRQPKILLLDEPTSALDLRRQLLVLDILRAYARGTHAVVVVVLHDLSLAARYCDHLLVVDRGQLACAGRPVDVLTAETISRVYQVEAEILVTSGGAPVIAPIGALQGSLR